MAERHVADSLRQTKRLVYPAFSKRNFYYREHISKFVLEQNCVPLNPFMIFNYYLLDTVPRDVVREANNNLVRVADELWAFGEVSDGVASEIRYTREMGRPVKFFSLKELPQRMVEIQESEVEFEKGIARDDLLPPQE